MAGASTTPAWMTAAQLRLSSFERLRPLTEQEATASPLIKALAGAVSAGGFRFGEGLSAHLRTAVSEEDAAASFADAREQVVFGRPGLIPLGKEDDFRRELALAHQNGDIVFLLKPCGPCGDIPDVVRSRS